MPPERIVGVEADEVEPQLASSSINEAS
jgi:hypothetical protein